MDVIILNTLCVWHLTLGIVKNAPKLQNASFSNLKLRLTTCFMSSKQNFRTIHACIQAQNHQVCTIQSVHAIVELYFKRRVMFLRHGLCSKKTSNQANVILSISCSKERNSNRENAPNLQNRKRQLFFHNFISQGLDFQHTRVNLTCGFAVSHNFTSPVSDFQYMCAHLTCGFAVSHNLISKGLDFQHTRVNFACVFVFFHNITFKHIIYIQSQHIHIKQVPRPQPCNIYL